jgi:hypothetical protein
MFKPAKPPENIGTVPVVPHASAQLVREQDPTGAIVVQKFRIDFERAQLSGNYARLDLLSTRSGKAEQSDKAGEAKYRISKALDDLGNGTKDTSASQSCIWNVIGLGLALEEWTLQYRNSGKRMNLDKVSGIFMSPSNGLQSAMALWTPDGWPR